MEIYIVRHGETNWNTKRLLQGGTNVPLNENGRAVAGETGKNMEGIPFNMIYSSPLDRAFETANLIRGHRNIPIIRDDRLRELSFGEYEGLDSKKLFANEDDPFHYFFTQPELFKTPKGGETLEEICIRAKEFLQEVIEPLQEQYERIMIVAHGAINKALMCHIKQHEIKDYWSGGLQRNCSVIIVKLENGNYEVIDESKLFYERSKKDKA